ncbi:MAG: hypothetical protein ACYDBJ_17985 [Aggregatilineales bacterium]
MKQTNDGPTWRNPGGALCRTVKIETDEPLPSTCPECGAVKPAWVDRGERVYLYPARRWHRFICPACLFLVVERAVPDNDQEAVQHDKK